MGGYAGQLCWKRPAWPEKAGLAGEDRLGRKMPEGRLGSGCAVRHDGQLGWTVMLGGYAGQLGVVVKLVGLARLLSWAVRLGG